jgi:hypothetical protein
MRRFGMTSLALTATLLASLALSASAQAGVVNANGHKFGVALVPGTGSQLAAVTDATAVTSGGTCRDPWLSPDLGGTALPAAGLCWQGGAASNGNAVLHRNETFDLTWDPLRRYWSGTRGYIEQFLRDVAGGSDTLSSPFAVTTQYRDANGKAANASMYGGGCIDYGNHQGDFTCQFAHAVVTGTGHNYPAGSCTSGAVPCLLSDGDVQTEVKGMVNQMGLNGRLQPGYKPLLVVLVPSGVQVCLDSLDELCSVGSGSTAQFCSYHSHVTVGSQDYAYVVQPWSAFTNCDESGLPEPVPSDVDAGRRIVNPLSQGAIDSIVNPWLDGWYANDGSEMSDNDGCVPDGYLLDKVTVGNSAQNPYVLAPEFNNAGVIENDPNAPPCALGVTLTPEFVVPSSIDAGEVVAFDGSVTASTLMVAATYPWTSSDGYHWNFGDGTSSNGPSVVHSFTKAGFYTVVLTVTDRGGNVRSLSQRVEVLQSDGQPPPGGSTSGGGGGPSSSKFKVHLQLLPQSLKDVLHHGLQVRASSTKQADGFATLLVSSSAAKRAHIHGTRTALGVVVGRGTVSGLKAGTVSLRVRFSSAIASKLSHLGYLRLTLRLALVDKSGTHLSVRATGRY